MVSARKAKEAIVARRELLVFRIALGAAGFFVVVCLLPTAVLMIVGLASGTVSIADPWDLLSSADGYPLFNPQAAWLVALPAATMFVLSIVTMPMGMGSRSVVDRPTLYVTSYVMAVLAFFVSVAFQGAPGSSHAGGAVGLVGAGLLGVAGVLFHLRNFFGSLDFVPRSWRPNLPEPAARKPDTLHTALVAGGSVARLQVQFDFTAWLQVPEIWPSPWGNWEYPDAEDWATSWGAVLAKRSRADAAMEAHIVAELRTIEAERGADESRFVYTSDPIELPLMFVSVWHDDARLDHSLLQLLAADAPAGSEPATIEPSVSKRLDAGIRSLRVTSTPGSALVAQYAWRYADLDVFVSAGPINPARSTEMLAATDTFALTTEVITSDNRSQNRA